MANSTVTAGSAPAPMNVFTRFIGVIFSPRQTFENVAAHPRVLGMLILICLLSAAVLGVFFSTQIGKDAWLEAATASRPDMPPEQFAMMEKMAGWAGAFAMGQAPDEVKAAATDVLKADVWSGGGLAEAAERAGLL